MITQLLEDIDGFQGLRVRPPKKGLDLRRSDEQPVKSQLELGKTTEDDVLVFDGD